MNIELYGRDFYRVESGGNTYFVDMEAHNGRGACDCPSYRCVLEPQRNMNGHKPCKHILAIKEQLGHSGIR